MLRGSQQHTSSPEKREPLLSPPLSEQHEWEESFLSASWKAAVFYSAMFPQHLPACAKPVSVFGLLRSKLDAIIADVKRASGLVGTSQCSQCGAREFCWFGFSNFPKVILMCFLQRTWGWNESHCSTEIVSLEQSSIGMWVLETAMGNVFACTRHSIWTNQYWAFYRGSGRGEELIGLGLQNVDFKIRPVITCLKNIFSHKASVDLTEMSWKKCEVFFVFSHAMYLCQAL